MMIYLHSVQIVHRVLLWCAAEDKDRVCVYHFLYFYFPFPMKWKHEVWWDLGVECQWRIASILIPHFLTLASLAKLRASFWTGGINSQAILTPIGSHVEVEIVDVPHAQWQIHELPVDYSIDPKLRCKTEHVGQHLYSGRNKDIIYNVTTTSLFLHSFVILVNDTVVSCGTIADHLRDGPAYFVTFKLGVFGKMYNWQREYKTKR